MSKRPQEAQASGNGNEKKWQSGSVGEKEIIREMKMDCTSGDVLAVKCLIKCNSSHFFPHFSRID